MSTRSLANQPAEAADTDRDSLPLWDGTHLSGLAWLRELEANQHLLDADVAHFLRTAAVVTSAAKTAVSSHEHSALLKNNIITKQNYSIRNPPPEDNFVGLYKRKFRTRLMLGKLPLLETQLKRRFQRLLLPLSRIHIYCHPTA